MGALLMEILKTLSINISLKKRKDWIDLAELCYF